MDLHGFQESCFKPFSAFFFQGGVLIALPSDWVFNGCLTFVRIDVLSWSNDEGYAIAILAYRNRFHGLAKSR